MKGYTTDNSKKCRERRAPWPARPYSAEPTRMSRKAPPNVGGSGGAMPPATHAKYGTDPDVGPNRASREAPANVPGGGKGLPSSSRLNYGVGGVTTKPNPGYGV